MKVCLLAVLVTLWCICAPGTCAENLLTEYCKKDGEIGKPLCPTLFILGVQKAGTSSLYTYLVNHASVLRAPKKYSKEAHYFDHYREENDDIKPLLDQFPTRHSEMDVGFDGTPNYFGMAHSASFIKKVIDVPKGRFIVVFKDPVARAWSWYKHSLQILNAMPATIECSYERHYDSKFSRMATDATALLNACRRLYPEDQFFAQCASDGEHWRSLVAAGDWAMPEKEQCPDNVSKTPVLWNFATGLYGPIMQHWLKHFEPSSFCPVDAEKLTRSLSSVEEDLRPCLLPLGIDLRIPEEDQLPSVNIHSSCELCESIDEQSARTVRTMLNSELYTESNMMFRAMMKNVYRMEFPVWEHIDTDHL